MFFNASKTSLKRFCCEKVLFTSTFESDIFCIATLRRGQRQGGWCDLCSDQVGGWRAPRSNQGSRSHDWGRFLKQGVISTKTCQDNVGQSTIAEIMPKSGTTLQLAVAVRRHGVPTLGIGSGVKKSLVYKLLNPGPGKQLLCPRQHIHRRKY